MWILYVSYAAEPSAEGQSEKDKWKVHDDELSENLLASRSSCIHKRAYCCDWSAFLPGA